MNIRKFSEMKPETPQLEHEEHEEPARSVLRLEKQLKISPNNIDLQNELASALLLRYPFGEDETCRCNKGVEE